LSNYLEISGQNSWKCSGGVLKYRYIYFVKSFNK